VLCGRTGGGQTRLLAALADQGAQTLDLEGLARHRGSVLGGLPGQAQPTQKHFDSLLWHVLHGFDAQRPVFVESESRKVGALRVPESLIRHMREHGECLRVEMDPAARLQLLLQDCGFFADDVDGFCRLLDSLVELRGRDMVRAWQAQARAGQWPQVFEALMQLHDDPLYESSLQRSFAQLDKAQAVTLRDGGNAALSDAARRLMA
jgi:tRNA 2-selenouridine synthase